MSQLSYFLLFILLLLQPSKSQAQLAGLGPYRIAHTTLTSLNRADFTEGEQTYVKGTLALECPHIRIFKAAHTIVDSIAISNLLLFFYDERLFAISCDYSDSLQNAFQAQHGQGIRKEPENFQLCLQQGSEPMTLWGKFWQKADILAFVVHTKGFTDDCTFAETNSLVIASQTTLALSSACNFREFLPFAEEFSKTIK